MDNKEGGGIVQKKRDFDLTQFCWRKYSEQNLVLKKHLTRKLCHKKLGHNTPLKSLI